ncbi:MAG: LysE family translocator [Actinobacteria bacterium]|jgi:threonine/homoserine/homoserine lactone efflux protein|nr:LysE family translocator [Actinomycetota bacterium]
MNLEFPSRYPEYLVAAMIIILAPGPSVLFIIARAIAWGRATAVATAAGNVTGAFTLSLAVAFGLGPILQRSDLAFLAVQLLGGLYLIYLGIDAIRHSEIHAEDMINQGEIRPSAMRSARDGFWVGALNPKGLVFFAAILPQFVDRDSGSVTAQLVLMGATFAILAFFSDGGWGLIAGTVRNWMANSPTRLVVMRRVGGTVMILLGLFTLLSAL